MPHLAATPPTSSAAAAAPAALPTGAGGVAFGHWRTVPRPVALRLRLRARAARREGGGGVRTEELEQDTMQRTFYDLLGISAEGSTDEVRAAYRRLALKYHPDVSPPGAAAENTRRFIEVQEAYETLSDPSRRASYDRALARGVCRLAFSGSRSHRAYYHHHQDHEEKSGWRRSWEDQVAELKRRSMTKDSDENLSWGARMRRRRAEASSAE
ncbi:chaperone protein dnaJ 20, chloroplastic-like [Panicum virgatum]|uniref:chaperone protein dnaJ 20, chloroplastic-like n=1 Tax=Panicum virgatum TaxID=38727 RepID=UPI0019D60345|nr:chaperone protein dnaJ 20, chloroplastic-like [Panicum virgatum]